MRCEEWTLDSKSAHQIILGSTETRKNVLWRHQRSLTSNDLGWPQVCHEVRANHDFHLITTIDMHITDQNTELLKLQALIKTLRNANSVWHDLENDVTGHGSFREGVRLIFDNTYKICFWSRKSGVSFCPSPPNWRGWLCGIFRILQWFSKQWNSFITVTLRCRWPWTGTDCNAVIWIQNSGVKVILLLTSLQLFQFVFPGVPDLPSTMGPWRTAGVCRRLYARFRLYEMPPARAAAAG